MDGVSVVICCYNSEQRIRKVLEHLAGQKVSRSVKWEVVVVDNASRDKTAETARRSWRKRVIPLRIIHEPAPGLSNARRTGLKEAAYQIVSLVDDDNWVEEKWIQKIYNHFRHNPSIGLLGGQGEPVMEEAPPSWFEKYKKCYAVGPQDTRSTKIMYGAGLTINKKAWNKLVSNGFRFVLSDRKGASLTSGGDSELCYAVMLAGYELLYDKNLKFRHVMPKERINWNYLMRLIQSFGRTDPVLNIYYSTSNEYTGYQYYIRENRWFVLMYSVYRFLLSCPPYFKILPLNKEGRDEEAVYLRNKHRMLEAFRLFPEFPVIVSNVKNGKWRQKPASPVLRESGIQAGQLISQDSLKKIETESTVNKGSTAEISTQVQFSSVDKNQVKAGEKDDSGNN
jgi:glycosyltransferase involved in cell wall biosynthesis